jgi:hypothetical protein
VSGRRREDISRLLQYSGSSWFFVFGFLGVARFMVRRANDGPGREFAGRL